MANPDYDAAGTDLHGGHRYNMPVAGEAVQSQAGPGFQAHVRHPFVFSTVAGQLPSSAFSQSPNTIYRPPPATAPGNPMNVYDGGFNPSPFSRQFPGEALNDRTGTPAASSYQTNVNTLRRTSAPFDNFPSLYHHVMPAVCASSSAPFYSSCQSAHFPSMSSSFMSRADGAGFATQLQSSASSASSHPWPPARPAFTQLPRFNESSVDSFCGPLLQNSAVGSDSVSSGSPVTELFDHASSPTQLPPAMYGCAVTLPSPSMSDLMESARHSATTSPVGGVQLSRSLPTAVRFNSVHSAGEAAAVVGYHPASRMHFDSMSPASQRSFFQPGSVLGSLDDSSAVGAGFQVEFFYNVARH